jgi:hypothetical protein
MLGEQIGESKGRRLLRRVISSDPMKVEVTFEDSGTMLGVKTSGFGTYVAELRPDGTTFGNGEGGMLTDDGEVIAWKGSGLGHLKAGGAVSYRGILYYRTASAKLAALNSAPGVFEYEVAADGTTEAKVWAWK